MLDWVLDMSLNCQSRIFSNYNDQSTKVLNQKTNVSWMSTFVVHIEIIAKLKNAGRSEVVTNSKKIGRQSSKLIHLSR